MRKLDKSRAADILQRCRIPYGVDFHTLSTSQVEALLEEARAIGYRQPKNANGSRARYFYAYVEREAKRDPF